jgi:hypothetical protein
MIDNLIYPEPVDVAKPNLRCSMKKDSWGQSPKHDKYDKAK